MKILLTGATGYIGSRLLPLLIEKGHEVYALIRHPDRFDIADKWRSKLTILQGNLLDPTSLTKIPEDIEAAYYLVHSMSTSESFSELERQSANHFLKQLEKTKVKQIIYLSGLTNESNLSPHLASRKKVAEILKSGNLPVTLVMAGIIIGSGSASFEIIRDLVEKLPIMVAPKWLMKKTQPIAVRDVLDYLLLVLGNVACFNQSFEIGGPDIMTYKDLLLGFAKSRGLKRHIFIVPVLTPRLSSYWLYFVTSTNFTLARFLVDSLINNAVCKENRIQKLFPKALLSYEQALALAFTKTEEDWVPPSWKDPLNGSLNGDLSLYVQVPRFGTLQESQVLPFSCPREDVIRKVWSLGGDVGWHSMNWAWKLRGFFDKLVGGVGLNRGRRDKYQIKVGDALDFWRVLLADKKKGRLLLYAEMKLPGEAWLEFLVAEEAKLYQTATFRPNGLLGRLYWYLLYPFHIIIFKRLAKSLVK